MGRIAQREGLIIGGTVVVFLALLFPALLYARREARDGIRRNEIAAFKQVLEQHYNKYEAYPLEFNAHPHEYVVIEKAGTEAASWYLRAELENPHTTSAGHDEDEGRKYDYRLIHTEGRTYYEVCGGTPTCALDDPR